MKPAEQQTYFEIYGTIFDGSMPKKLRQMLDKEEKEYPLRWKIEQGTTKKDLIKGKNWKFSYNYFLIGHWEMIFSFIISAPCIQLHLNYNNYSKILTDISRPNLYALIIFSLCIFMYKTAHNNILSIERLQFIEMPFLEILFLENNEISKASALNKCAWNHLWCLDLSYNKISAYEIARLKISERPQDQSNQQKRRPLQICAPFEYLGLLPKLNFSLLFGSFKSIRNLHYLNVSKENLFNWRIWYQ